MLHDFERGVKCRTQSACGICRSVSMSSIFFEEHLSSGFPLADILPTVRIVLSHLTEASPVSASALSGEPQNCSLRPSESKKAQAHLGWQKRHSWESFGLPPFEKGKRAAVEEIPQRLCPVWCSWTGLTFLHGETSCFKGDQRETIHFRGSRGATNPQLAQALAQAFIVPNP